MREAAKNETNINMHSETLMASPVIRTERSTVNIGDKLRAIPW